MDTIETISDLENYTGTSDTVIVKDNLRGGTFKYVTSGLTVDNGTVFIATGKGSGYWERLWDIQYGVNVLWYGADPTGVNDCAVIIEDVISKYSQSGKVYIPAGDYRITTTIGDVGTGSTKHITNNVTIYGTLGTNINVDSPTQISSVIGFDIRGVDVVFQNLNLNAGNKANRGIYIRQQLQDAPLVRRSNLTIKNCNISDMFGTTGNIETSIAGIAVYGYFENVFVYENNIKNVITDTSTLPVKGMFTAGSATNGVPINSKVFRNNIRNVSRSDTSSLLDQDGIHISGLSVNNSLYNSEVWGNTIYDCRGRMIKVQTFNNSVYDNLLIISDSYQMPSSHDGSAINIQYSDANIFNNTLIHRNTDNNSFNAMVGFIERTTDAHEHRLNVYGNRIYAFNIKYFITLWENNQAMLGTLNCYDNVVDATVDSFIWYLGYNATPTQRNVNLKGNVIKSIVNTFVNSSINQITFNLNYNINRGAAVAASNASNSLFLTNNIGLTNANSYELINAAKSANTISVSTNYTVLGSDFGTNGEVFFTVNTNSGNLIITLPASMIGKSINIIKTDNTTNTVTVKGNGSMNINNSNTKVLTSQYENVRIMQNSTQYYIV